MVKATMKFVGLDKLGQKLKTIQKMDAVKDIVQKNGAKLQRTIVRKAVFRGHWEGKKFVKPTGATRRSVQLSISANKLTAKAGPTTHYSAYLEKGTRYMSAQPFVGPAFDEVKKDFVKDLERLVK